MGRNKAAKQQNVSDNAYACEAQPRAHYSWRLLRMVWLKPLGASAKSNTATTEEQVHQPFYVLYRHSTIIMTFCRAAGTA
jgi:hypothetical protein